VSEAGLGWAVPKRQDPVLPEPARAITQIVMSAELGCLGNCMSRKVRGRTSVWKEESRAWGEAGASFGVLRSRHTVALPVRILASFSSEDPVVGTGGTAKSFMSRSSTTTE
jgi:hypothetical protein